MADFPALPIWTDAYFGDTRHLSTLEHGAYLLLLMEAWRRPRCALPDNDALLARLVGLTVDEWAEVRETVMAFWKRDDKRKEWTQKRLTKERAFVAQKSKVQRDRARKRWKQKKKDDATAMPTHMPEACRSDAPTPTPTPTPTSSVVPNGTTGAEAPLDVDAFFYREGRRILGKQNGALLTMLKRAKGTPAEALKVLEVAQRKADPVAYVAAACQSPADVEAEIAEIVQREMYR